VPPPARSPLAAPETPSAPLSESALAARTEIAQPPAPVIHLTIDRIDVRPSAPARPAAAGRRARSEPSVTLAELLGGGSRSRP
jgi:hypothetical protein